MAECAILNGQSAELITSRIYPVDHNTISLQRRKEELVQDQAQLLTLLHKNTSRVVVVMRAVPDADLSVELQMPWGLLPIVEEMGYIYWNMSYHQGQINYIASLL